jgi:nucleotide-binding universal stress UspA family protein
MLPVKKILCPTDFSEPSSEAIKVASELASQFGSELLLLHVVAPLSVPPEVMGLPPATVPVGEQELEASAKRSLEERVGRLHAEGLRARFLLRPGNAADEILRAAEEEKVDQIVIASHGRTGLNRILFGSVAEKVVRSARCPVLTVPARVPEETAEEAASEEGKAREKSEKRKAGEEKIKSQLREGEAKIEELRANWEALRKKWLEAGKSGEEAWEGLKVGVEKALEDLKNSLEQTMAKMKDKGIEVSETVSKGKEGYVQRIDAQLKDWGGKIDALKNKAESSGAEVKMKYLQRVEELKKKQEAARKKLQDIKGSSSQAWVDMKGGVDQALAELKKGVSQALSRFREK